MTETQRLMEQIQALQEENNLYKKVIKQMPFSFMFTDDISKKKLIKDQDEDSLKIETIESNQEGEYGLRITSNLDVFFEKIESFLSQILDHVPHHITFINRDGIVTLCNLQAAKDLQVNRDEIVGKHIRELLNIPDDQIAVLQTIQTNEPIVNREILDHNYGIINTRIIHNFDGSIKRVIGTFLFLNNIKEYEKQALAGRIAAGIAHEIRNPLTTVRGYLQLLQTQVEPKISTIFTTLLIPEIDRSNKIITDFLSIAKPIDGEIDRLNVRNLVEEYIGKFLHSEAYLHDVELFFHLDSQANLLFIEGNRDELLQVFLNLFQNSLQAKKDNRLKITINTEIHDATVKIVFSDNGSGMKPSILEHVFDPFFSTKDDGTGLGLSISKKIIENHNGKMEVCSGEEGTVFTVELPTIR